MPNATLRFKLPEEQNDFLYASHGGDLVSTIADYDEYLRGLVKHGGVPMDEVILSKMSKEKRKEYEGVVRSALDWARTKLWEHVSENNADSLFE